MLHGVHEQVRDRSRELAGVHTHRQIPRQVAVHRDLPVARSRTYIGDGVADDIEQRDVLEPQAQCTGVDPGEIEEVVDHGGEQIHLGAHLAVVPARVVDHLVFQCLGHRPDARQRRAQVVRDPRDQFPA